MDIWTAPQSNHLTKYSPTIHLLYVTFAPAISTLFLFFLLHLSNSTFNLKLAPSRIFYNCIHIFIMYSLFTISPATFFRWVGNSTHFSHISPNSFSVTFSVNQLAQTQGNILYTTKYCLSPFKLILFANLILFTTTIVLLQPNYSKMMYVDCIRNVE